MFKICRTCLRKTKATFKINQSLPFGDSEQKISFVLRFCIPELYLGISSNPEICYDCKESLKVAYVFKKKCLSTEHILGDYLKSIRCTGRSVQLYDVITYLEEEAQSKNEKKAQESAVVNAQDIISEWEDVPDSDGSNDIPLIEVRQSAPNPSKPYENPDDSKICEDPGLLYKRNKLSTILKGIIETDKELSTSEIKNSEAPPETSQAETTQIATNDEELSDNFPKITSVYSLSEDVEENVESPKVDEAPKDKPTSEVTPDLVDNNTIEPSVSSRIKDEPLDIEINNEGINPNYASTDEDTLDASETASYDNMECDSNLQGIIDSLPELNDTNQYVDVPEFVQINNFGPRELEELRQQQLKEAQKKLAQNKKTVTSFNNESQTPVDNSCVAGEVALPPLKQINHIVVKNSATNETMLVNAKDVVKCTDGYFILRNDHKGLKQILLEGNAPVKYATVGTQGTKRLLLRDQFTTVPLLQKIGNSQFIKKKEIIKNLLAKEPMFLPVDQNEAVLKAIQPLSIGDKNQLKDKPPAELPEVKNQAKTCSKRIFPDDAGNVQDETTSNAFKTTGSKSSLNNAVPQETLQQTLATKFTVDSRPPQKRGRKKVKIVPVTDASNLGHRKVKSPLKSEPVKSDRDVVVLFTNYTWDGFYVNDHDYLINPYKRNKVLFESSNSEWLCMCYICHKEHRIPQHVRHMNAHGSICKLCMTDLGSAYMLNVHVRSHTKPCKLCTERVPYGLIESHKQEHIEEEMEYEEVNSKRPYKRRKLNNAEKTPRTDEPEKKDAPSDMVKEELVTKSEDSEAVCEPEEPAPKKRRGRKRKIKIEDSPQAETSYRVLRSKARKSYNETDLDISMSDSLEDMSTGTEPP